MSQKVELPNHGTFWFFKRDDGSGPLAPMEHCDSDGHIVSLKVALYGESYAHVFVGGVIKRHGEKIGVVSDLVEVK